MLIPFFYTLWARNTVYRVFKRFTYKFLLVTLLLAFGLSSHGQNHRDSFTEKMDLALSLARKNSEEAIKQAGLALEIAKEARDEWAVAVGVSTMGRISYLMRDYEVAYVNYSDALNLLRKSDTTDYDNELNILRHLAIINSKYSNYDESISLRLEAQNVAKSYLSKYPKIAEDRGHLGMLNDISYFLAVEYGKKGAHKTAGDMLMKLWQRAEDKDDIVMHARVLNKLGEIKKKNGEYKEAAEYFGLIVAEREVSKKYKAMAYHNLAETYMVQGNYSKAESFYLNALDFKKEIADARSTFITYQGLGELAYKKGDMQEAINYWETGLGIFDKVEGEPELYSIYNSLQLAYMDVDVEKAKTFNQTHMQLNDFYVRNQTFQREDDAAKREALSMLIDKQRQKRVDAAQRQQFIREFWPVFLGVALLVIFSIFLGVRYYMALKANKLLTKSQLKMQEAQAGSNTSETTED